MQSPQCILDFPMRQSILVLQQSCLRNYVISESAFRGTFCIAGNNFFRAARTSVISYIIFSNHDRLRFGNFFDNFDSIPKGAPSFAPQSGHRSAATSTWLSGTAFGLVIPLDPIFWPGFKHDYFCLKQLDLTS